MMTKILVVTDSKNAPLVVPEGVIKLLWYVSNPLPALPTTLKILMAPYVSVVGSVPDGLVFLEVTGNTLVNHAKIPNTCHIEVIDYGCLQNLKLAKPLKESSSEIGKVCVENCVPHNANDLISMLRTASNRSTLGFKNNIMAKIKRKLKFVWDILTYPSLRDFKQLGDKREK